LLASGTTDAGHGRVLRFHDVLNAELEVLTHTPGLVLALVLGLLWGSFANVCIYRWPPSDEFPDGRSVVKPGSHCSSCKSPVRWYDNVPIFSYLWLRGRCRSCKTAFSPRYLVVEAVTAMLFGTAWWFTLGTGGMFQPLDVRALWFIVDAAFVFTMVVITFIDLDHKLILDKVTWPAIVLGYAVTFALPGYRWWDGLIGAGIGYGVPWLIGEIYFRITGREGLGLGDSTLLAAVGALLGWRGVVVALFGGSVIGSVIGIAGVLVKRSNEEQDNPDEAASVEGTNDAPEADSPSLMKTELPFGPFLATAAVFYLFAAPWIDLHFRL
jgi:leader peptidase (prepilin peptidase) / N-methyltransferase